MCWATRERKWTAKIKVRLPAGGLQVRRILSTQNEANFGRFGAILAKLCQFWGPIWGVVFAERLAFFEQEKSLGAFHREQDAAQAYDDYAHRAGHVPVNGKPRVCCRHLGCILPRSIVPRSRASGLHFSRVPAIIVAGIWVAFFLSKRVPAISCV